ncbi:hypothetical protein HC031_21575 [Planosporangium thailandense]|uniref:Uncharacterized protein n=1 Tax=Planosporangium thailandense TaxID=765197 RepID=A0ABX0Y1Q7_9ACTN|nr:hypothetical protein [Planosporangium thailandense]NJC72286.1 hypothetical protein [Planosporangium thailandense]
MAVLCALAAALTVATLATFVWALVSLRRLPVGRRPLVTVYSRTGKALDVQELNPPDPPPP